MHFLTSTTDTVYYSTIYYQRRRSHYEESEFETRPLRSTLTAVSATHLAHNNNQCKDADDTNAGSSDEKLLRNAYTNGRIQSGIQLDDEEYVHNCVLERCQRVVINVSGQKFETQLKTLERLPNTLLGDEEKRRKYWVENRQEYFFDRHRPSFQAILYYYQSGSRLRRPMEVPHDVFINEISFYQLGERATKEYLSNEGYETDKPHVMPKHAFQRALWNFVEDPSTSFPAKCFAALSIFLILTSVAVFCIETLPDFQDSGCMTVNSTTDNGTVISEMIPNYGDPLFIVESICIAWFIIELLLRFTLCPEKKLFLKNIINWFDFLSILPYIIYVCLVAITADCQIQGKTRGLSVLRVLRVVRIFKLSKHSTGLQLLGKTMKTSLRELVMFLMFMALGVIIFSGAIYHAERANPYSQFASIPESFWWAIVTMTTVGYGDIVPIGIPGKLIGGMCVLSGVLAIALPVPVIVANFNTYYLRSKNKFKNPN